MSGFHSTFYTEYITSDAWAKRRAAYYKTHHRVCWGCHSNRKIHLHHQTYERLGDELDGDLVPLCSKCHEEVHLYHDSRKAAQTLAISTQRWLAAKRRKIKRRPPKPKKPNAHPPGKSDPVNDAFRRIRENRRVKKGEVGNDSTV